MGQFQRVAFYTLGCKLNFAETSTLARQFTEAGFAKVDFHETADFYVINTCSVTENADKKCRNMVRKANKRNPAATVIVVGCYAQLKPQEIANIEGVDLVLGANEKFDILKYTQGTLPENKVVRHEIKNLKTFVPGFSAGDRTRTFLKVQDGCDYFCSFCTIPLARGRSRSASVAETLASAEKAIAKGAKEIVLTGVNIGDFGSGTDESFLDLIRELDALEGATRFRISSIEPNLLSDAIIDFVASSKKFMPHFHIPLQSGNDEMLQEMRRRYDTALYRQRIQRIQQKIPHACIGVDVIVGFPGETDAHFDSTVDFLKSLDVSYLHVFTYSERANTTALRKDTVIPKNIRYDRTRLLNVLSHKLKRAFYQAHQHTTRTVLWEKEDQEGYMYGYTDNYIRVRQAFNPAECNKETEVTLAHLDADGFYDLAPQTSNQKLSA